MPVTDMLQNVALISAMNRDLPKLAKSPPSTHQDNPTYSILRSFQFDRDSWPGYAHRMTKGFSEGTGTGADREKLSGKEAGEDRCWEFYLAPKPTINQ